MLRRIAAVFLLLGLLATLVAAARHNHLNDQRSVHGDVCVHCSGAMLAGPLVPALKTPAAPVAGGTWLLPTAPIKPSLLRLDHSGCAPPGAG